MPRDTFQPIHVPPPEPPKPSEPLPEEPSNPPPVIEIDIGGNTPDEEERGGVVIQI